MWYKNVGTTFFCFVTHLTDRQTDRQTDKRTDGFFIDIYRALHYMQLHVFFYIYGSVRQFISVLARTHTKPHINGQTAYLLALCCQAADLLLTNCAFDIYAFSTARLSIPSNFVCSSY